MMLKRKTFVLNVVEAPPVQSASVFQDLQFDPKFDNHQKSIRSNY